MTHIYTRVYTATLVAGHLPQKPVSLFDFPRMDEMGKDKTLDLNGIFQCYRGLFLLLLLPFIGEKIIHYIRYTLVNKYG